MRGKLLLNFSMKSYLVGHVDEIGFFRLDFFYEVKCLFKSLMRIVRLLTQRIDNKYVHILKETGGFIGESAHVGNVSHASHTIGEDGHLTVHYGKRNDLHATDFKGSARRQFVHDQTGYAGIEVLSKAIRQLMLQKVYGLGVSINIDIAKSAERAKVVYASRVVVVYVCKQQTVYGTEVDGNHLLAEVGSAIDENAFTGIEIDKCGTAQAFVARVRGCAYRTLATYLRNAGAGACT